MARRWALLAALALSLPRPAAAPPSPPATQAPPAPPTPTEPCATSPLCQCSADYFTCYAVPFHRFPDTDGGVRHVSVWGARLGALEEAALDARALHTLVLVACRLDALHRAALAQSSLSANILRTVLELSCDLRTNVAARLRMVAWKSSTLLTLPHHTNTEDYYTQKKILSMSSTLASLDLGHNEFTEVPLEALRDLKVLNWLNLQNNFISDLDPAVEWGGLAESLSSLSLSNNRLTRLRGGALSPLRALLQLELDGNRLHQVAAGSLPRGLAILRLSDNLLPALPCAALAALPRLAHLALRDNMLRAPLPPACGSAPASLAHLHTLDLAHNSLTDDFQLELGPHVQLRHLILDLNDLTTLPTFLIQYGRLEKLSVSHNRLTATPEPVLGTLAPDLRQLELDHNELGALPAGLRNMTRLRRLSAAYNRLQEVSALPPRLYSLSLAGNMLTEFPAGLRELVPGALAHLDLGYTRIAHVTAATFGAWATGLSTLSLRGCRLASLGVGAFPVLPLRELALSFNELFTLEPGALTPLRALAVLELAGVLAAGALPRGPSGLTWFALDNNDIYRVTAADLLAHPHLEYLNLDFNKIEAFPSDTERVAGNASSALKELRLAYNYVGSVNGEFLSMLSELQSVDLSYNRMRNVSKSTFSNLNNLVFVSLAGNLIERVSAGAFRALPRLQALELQENRLAHLATDMFERVAGEETNLSVNVSHNEIATLAGGGVAPISVLDLSHNALESLSTAFFDGIAAHLRRLLLAHNRLAALDGLGARTLPRLAVLNLRDNELESVRRRVLGATPALQELDLARNRLAMLAPDQFCSLRSLRSLCLAGNWLRAVPPGALAGTLLEALDLRDNRLTAPPAAAVARVGFTLRRLELAGNALRRLDAAALAGVGFLRDLGLARTALRVLPDAALAGLARLRRLDLSHNALIANYRELLHPVPRLRRLALAGAGLRAVPALPLPALHELDLSGNAIATCRDTELRALAELRALNLSHNRLTALQPAPWAAVPQLAVLDVSHNPLSRVPGGALEGLPRLLQLRMHGLHVEALEPRALLSLGALRALELDAGRGSTPGAALAAAPQLQALTLYAREATLDEQLVGLDAAKMRAVEVRGEALRRLTVRALAPLGRARTLTLRLRGTRLAALPAGLAARLARVPVLALELSDNALAALAPAALYPNLTGWNRRATKLLSGGLVVQEGALRCGCGAAWLGAWLRRWTREVGGGARGAAMAARRSWCAARAPGAGPARRALLALEPDAARCHASALSARAPPPPRAAALLALGALALLLHAS